jgi:hypothetical protein
MNTLEIKRKVLKLNIDGSEYEIKEPNVKMVSEFEKSEDKGSLEAGLKFLAQLGLPIEVSETLTAQNIKEIFDHLVSGVKKN